MTDDDFDKIGVDEDFADEFDFVDEENKTTEPTGAETSTPTNSSRRSGLPIGKIITVIVLAVASFYGYKYLTTHKKQHPATVAQEAPASPPASTVDNTPVADTGAEDQLATAVPADKSFEQVQQSLQTTAPAPAIPDEINATLDSISQEMTLNVNQIKQLETTISNLTDTVDQLNKSISAMDNRVLSLTETVDGLAQDLTNVKKVMADEDMDIVSGSSIKLSSSNAPAPNARDNAPDYVVHAIIPGRAWLKSNKGQILTVTEGDKIGDYGTVAQIDAANGLVRTSSGITFR
jgi:hypothetical protein